jgi:ketosteroid isomerase-like protein
MTTETIRAFEEGCIRAAIDERTKALRAAHLAQQRSCHAMDVMPGEVSTLETRMRATQNLEGWLSSFRGPAGCEVHELSVTTDDDVAFGHGVLRITGARPDGGEIDVWTPATFCLRKVDGAWTVTEERTPVPVHMRGARQTGRKRQLCA